MKRDNGFTHYGSFMSCTEDSTRQRTTLLYRSKTRNNTGFTLIELLVVISIIAFLSSVISVTLTSARHKARDSNRIQNAKQISTALELYEQTNNTYKIPTAGLNNEGGGYVAKGNETAQYTNSILSILKSSGLYNSSTLKDPIYGTDNYYLGLCTSTNAYNVFLKVEQDDLKQSSTTILQACDGPTANSLGFNYVSATVGGNSGGLVQGAGSGGGVFTCGSTVTGSGLDTNTYGTILAEGGKCWLDRNLGATQVATAYNDHLAYGSMYQWGRGSDGHQLISYTSSTTGASVYGSTSTLSSVPNPPRNRFIVNSVGPWDWRTSLDDTLWQGVDAINNPCPTGFRVPTITEWQTWLTAANLTTASCGGTSSCHPAAYNSLLKLTTAGHRNRSNATLSNLGYYSNYWSSSVSGSDGAKIGFYPNAVYPASSSQRGYGFAVRCIKDQ